MNYSNKKLSENDINESRRIRERIAALRNNLLVMGSVNAYAEYERIKNSLYRIEDYHLKQELSNELTQIYLNIQEREKKAKKDVQQREQQTKTLITQYKSAWRKRNFLWKAFNQKLNPYKKNLSYYSDSQLEENIEKVSKRK